MSNSIKGSIQAILFLIISHCLFALLLAIPMYYYVLSQESYEIIALIASCLLWCVAGFLLGRSIYQKAFFRVLPIMGCYMGIVLLYSILNQEFSFYSLGFQIFRMLLFFGSTRVFMNKKNTR